MSANCGFSEIKVIFISFGKKNSSYWYLWFGQMKSGWLVVFFPSLQCS